MEIKVAGGNIAEQEVDTIVVQLAEDARSLAGPAARVDEALGGAISEMLRSNIVSGRSSDNRVVPTLGRIPASRVIVHGVGPRNDVTPDSVRRRNGSLSRWLRDIDAGRVAVSTYAATSWGDDAQAGARALAEAYTLGLYRFDKHHTRAGDRPRGAVRSVTLVEPAATKLAAVRRGAEEGSILGEAQNLARDLGNEPANLMTPTIVAEHAQRIASELDLECTIIERAEAERLGMGSYLSVAQGTDQPPKFIVLRYAGGRGRNWVGLVGKGITFDSGGISLKPPGSMLRMKADMSGAATVLGAIQAIAKLEAKVNVMAIAPCTENLPSGRATKPGDVVYSMDGQSIEILNTDAEGRLVLADAIAYAKQQRCTTLVDVATLTGAMSVALGHVRIGTFVNDDRLWRELERASDVSGERLWRMPLDREYDEMIRSDIADVKNTGGRPAGSITAAKFLERFAGETPWAHLDIAGAMDAARDDGIMVKGISGTPVRTLVHFVLNRSR